MRRPKTSDCTDNEGNFDSECYGSVMDDYEDFCREEEIERRWNEEDEVGDQIHEQNKDERDEKNDNTYKNKKAIE